MATEGKPFTDEEIEKMKKQQEVLINQLIILFNSNLMLKEK